MIEDEHESQWAAINSITAKIACTAETLRRWVRQAERDSGRREGRRRPSVNGSRRSSGKCVSCAKPTRTCTRPRRILPRRSSTAASSDEGLHRRSPPGPRGRAWPAAPIRKVLPIASSTYYEPMARKIAPARQSARARRDELLCEHVQRIRDENFQVYGARKVWRQLQREGIAVARCTVERLMRKLGLQGVVRGKPVKTTASDKTMPCPLDRVNRQFRAERPNALWVSDFTYVSTWQGFVYVAFIIDVFARCIVGWKVSSSARTDFVLDALEQALYARRPVSQGGLIHHSDRGVQYVSIRYTERLAGTGIEPSVGSVGDSYDNALAETINGLYKAEVIHRQSWKNRGAVEMATLAWVDGFNHRRRLEPIGNVPPAGAEAAYYRQLDESAMVA
ncbi:IS3 family transposase [Azorhizophilus paspali]|uniref:IS3 family transposase n=1 Tax=Azorhizophilus paspali TaxID=69963 RepID=UPI00364092BA